ncbi:Predicted symporter [Mycobacteroides abscessus subsp. massiliense]|uniref:hypothetical protein n=1 Tax=Mycobacteroides abscessus TaxID=36809 RepID=UPI0009A7D359|nr:hypothetical protein [Mycobacteroides abscessus]MDO3055625.1 hypothetical protein [Mycobacteroides abscessus subsp. massiliense]SLC37923.1 Predicted symporter [Mycobacteroides abscessus subsp. massiliense]SLH30467.1 Predicted symporter [Mycobacteroides abscessus subsp. massiliense]SLI03464.1 Predicted symporter [Mycobacteroides abscessus subsp. massiliense]
MLGKKTTVGLVIATLGLALAVLFGTQAEKSTHCDPSEMHHSATTATEQAYENQANRYCSHPPADSLAVPAGLGVVVAIGGGVYAAISESRRRKLASAIAHRAELAYQGYQESRARQAQEREAREQADAEAAARAMLEAEAQATAQAVPPPPPAPSSEFAGNSSPAPVYDYPAYAEPAPTPAPVEDAPPPPAPAPAPAPSSNGDDDPFGGLFS